MTEFLIAAKLLAGNALSAAFKWLQTASVWQVLFLGSLVLISVQHFELVSARHDAARWQKQATGLQTQLDGISTAKNVQKQTTTRTVGKVVQGQVQIRTIVQHIHDAPNPPDCGTPALDQLRNEL